jgi:hypothetical protein
MAGWLARAALALPFCSVASIWSFPGGEAGYESAMADPLGKLTPPIAARGAA